MRMGIGDIMDKSASAHNGHLVLLTVHGVYRCNQGINDIYEVVGQGWKLFTTLYHAFLVIREGTELRLSPNEIRKGDLVWVDKSAFLADGSMYLR